MSEKAPVFKNEIEETNFWGKHDLAEFYDAKDFKLNKKGNSPFEDIVLEK
jgi:hypothetical protein